MTYRQRNKKKNVGLKIIIGCIVLFVILRFAGINLTDGVLKNSFTYIVESKTIMFSPLRNLIGYFESKSKLEEENKNLKAENVSLKLDTLTNQTINEEFEVFKKQFSDPATNTTPIKVVLKPPFMPFDIIQISGNLDSVNIGDLVFFQNVVIGTLIEKTNKYGSVELFSTPGKVIPASVKGTQFEAKGLGGGRYVMEVAKDFDITEGEAIIYPHEKVILLGVVGQIESNEEDLFKKIYFNTPVTLDSISYITIGIQTHEQTASTN